jgi:hypothetical protein
MSPELMHGGPGGAADGLEITSVASSDSEAPPSPVPDRGSELVSYPGPRGAQAAPPRSRQRHRRRSGARRSTAPTHTVLLRVDIPEFVRPKTFKWFKDDKEVAFGPNRTLLVAQRAGFDPTGEYRCVVRDDKGRDVSEYVLGFACLTGTCSVCWAFLCGSAGFCCVSVAPLAVCPALVCWVLVRACPGASLHPRFCREFPTRAL